ncbi:5'-3' exoribonuclease 2 [Metarhizium album ARSEF 1941]|uniref:5'-3' exoribonuclease n=1 Tax=Metarhizium album (strain ARSEF 1941) TaxID=1081103 RepID=A0A0B2X255_METAS|nr:5'-3' exoribonuclease 2 [Metarhizium album ARSEF 1941]KHN99275.1 5'-3' exoribonuclease 2 [Metarhizium album ARSEF 1941]
MGIPAAFRWLSNKYPKIISPVIEDQPVVMPDGSVVPVDTTSRNPNGEEFDNLYLDMNGIVHPCAHPEDKPAPEDEEAMMLEVFRYTDRVVNMVRPRKLLMIAVDGVAPRAKMNQQRSRRFRSAQDAKEKEENKKELLKLVKQQNGGVLPSDHIESATKKVFDNNSITPAWAKMKVLISDATVPGEGEHKIMSFIRSQRASPEYDPNTRHVIYGLDADLIMLGLATHEPHFRVLREDVFFQEGKARTCQLCGQKGHEARTCRGELKEKTGDVDDRTSNVTLKPFIWLHVSVLREYLAAELAVPGLPFRFDLERAIDDWVFMCCFVGNDFLPHLPALEIREHGIDTLTTIWRNNLPSLGGYVTKDGHIDLERAQRILDGLAKQEGAIFKRRKEQEDRREANAKRRKLQHDNNSYRGSRRGPAKNSKDGHHDPSQGLPLYSISSYPKEPPRAITHDMVVNKSSAQAAIVANKSAASIIKGQIRAANRHDSVTTEPEISSSVLGKRKAESQPGMEAADTDAGVVGAAQPSKTEHPGPAEEPIDTVRLWEDGYADRYYQQKFHRSPNDISFRHKVARAYVEGLAWVLLYYFQGCPSWDWYYPYHYAPFAADFKDLAGMNIVFEKGRVSKPFEQLMSVLPAASRHALPEVFHPLMTDQDSEIIDFYPEDFEVDLNGKKMAWQGVALLPFIDMPRLLAAVQNKYPLLSPVEATRNATGRDVLLLSDSNGSMYDEILTKFYSKRQECSRFKLNPKTSDGLSGKVEKQDDYVPHSALQYPLERRAMPDLDFDKSVSDIEVIRGKSRRGDHPGYGRGGGHGVTSRGNFAPVWRPPPPGGPGFGVGVPPPPPVYGNNSYYPYYSDSRKL